MGRSQSERTLKMKAEFMSLHEQGLSIPEIAKKFHLSPSRIYYLLDEIAKAASVTRESLLQTPHAPHIGYTNNGANGTVPVPIDLIEYQGHVQKTLSEFNDTLSAINQYINAQEKIQVKEGQPEC